MRSALASVILMASLPAWSQGVEKHFYLDVHWFSPSIQGHFDDTSGSNPINVDLKNDLGLAKDQTKLGFGAEYQGTRFALELSRDEQTYKGSNRITQDIVVNGQTFTANTVVTSSLKATNNTFNWTIRCLALEHVWVGIDLGARVTQFEIDATGLNPPTGMEVTATYKTALPIPQIGPSVGFQAADDRVLGRAYFHFLTYEGATYTHPAADLRLFPVSWLGLRVFAEAEHFKIPQGSIKSDLDVDLDRAGTGLGVVVRF
jgi:hypothetical protein